MDASDHRYYYSNSRPELHDLVPRDVGSLLDVGCGEGAFGAALMADRPSLKVWGVEMHDGAAAVAASRYAGVLVAPFHEVLGQVGRTFDCIAFNDVLEHMIDPWGVLASSKQLLADGGVVLVSLPNVASFGVLAKLLRDDFTYEDSGVMDRTHLRFFTRKTAVRMAEGAGFHVRVVRHSWPLLMGWQRKVVERLGLGRFNGRQIVMLLEPQ